MVQFADALAGVVCGPCDDGRCGLGPCFAENRRTVLQGALGDLAAWFEDDELLAGDEGEHRVGCGFGVFDEVAVDGKSAAVEACQGDHDLKFLPGLSSAGVLESIETVTNVLWR